MFTCFLLGLTLSLIKFGGEILRKDPKLDLDQTFAYVRHESQQCLTMASTPDTAVRPLNVHGPLRHVPVALLGLKSQDHSKAPRKNRSKSLNTSSSSDPVSPTVPTALALASASVAITGTQGYVLHSSSKKHTWVIDTRATDHMTFDPRQITSHTLSSQSVVSKASGTPSSTFLAARGLVVEEHRNANTSQISELFPSESPQTANDWSQDVSDQSPETLPETDRLQDASDWSLETLPERDRSNVENDWSSRGNPHLLQNDRSSPGNLHMLQNDRSLEYRHTSSPCYQTQEEKIEEFLPALDNSLALVPHQSLTEDIIQVISFSETDNINEISHDDLISEGTEPAYQIPKSKNCGKPPVHYEEDLNAKGKYPINNNVSFNILSVTPRTGSAVAGYCPLWAWLHSHQPARFCFWELTKQLPRVVTHPGIAPASNSLNFGVPTNPKPVSSQKASHYEDARCAI
ncbi:hypothetical protein L3X38_032661 [Prunus dulcis]|uniref:Uncharacterized protein n=1 Tax=Prunus dulcis TaxID=3755 RepID=A0AAD4YW87_PRUDU|nr:hypothetical protein L3X38_032661 [Prunus dulcis]